MYNMYKEGRWEGEGEQGREREEGIKAGGEGKGCAHLLINFIAHSYSCWKLSDENLTSYGLCPAETNTTP